MCSSDLQLSVRARILALVVLPTPRVPVNRNARCNLSPSIAFWRVFAMCSCPTMSEKDFGRHLRAIATYAMYGNVVKVCNVE